MQIVQIVLLLATAGGVQACACTKLNIQDAVKSYGAVFSGEIASVAFVDSERTEDPLVIVTLKLIEGFKGVSGEEVVMHTRRRDGECEGLPPKQLRVGTRLLVYALRTRVSAWPNLGEILTTQLCSRNQLLDEAADEEIRQLRRLAAK